MDQPFGQILFLGLQKKVILSNLKLAASNFSVAMLILSNIKIDLKSFSHFSFSTQILSNKDTRFYLFYTIGLIWK